MVTRSVKAAIYEQRNKKEKSDISIGFEVFKIKIQKEAYIPYNSGPKKGELYYSPEKEKFPGNEDFGKWAWAYSNKECAMKKFEEIA
jgi:hypothetical protein